MTNNSKGFVSTHRTIFSGKKCSFFSALTVMTIALTNGPKLNAQDGSSPYKNSNLAVDTRIADLIGRMTLEEKARQLDMYFGCEALLETNQYTGRTHAKPDAVFNPEIDRKS